MYVFEPSTLCECVFQIHKKRVYAKTGACVQFSTNSSQGKFVFTDLDTIMD